MSHGPADKEGIFSLSWWPPCNVAFGIRQLSAASLVLQTETQAPSALLPNTACGIWGRTCLVHLPNHEKGQVVFPAEALVLPAANFYGAAISEK